MDWSIIGYVATAIDSIKLIPEVKKALRTHHLRDLAWGMLLLMLCSSSLWTMYGFYLESPPLIISGMLNICMELMLITLKVFFARIANWNPTLKSKDVKIEEKN